MTETYEIPRPVRHGPVGAVPAASWGEMRRRLARDRERLDSEAFRSGATVGRFTPSRLAVQLYRLSNFFYRRNRRLLARMFWQLNLMLTGADIAPLTEAGGGLVILHPMSTKLFGTLGDDCTIWGYGGLGGGRSPRDVGGCPGLPVLGDRVELGARALVLGPVRIGDDCHIGAGCLVLDDLPAGTRLVIPPSAQAGPASRREEAGDVL